MKFSESDWGLWRHHPVTKAFRRFMTDYAYALERDHLDRWQSGKIDLDIESEAKGRVNTLKELADLPFNAIEEFYQQPEQENAAENIED